MISAMLAMTISAQDSVSVSAQTKETVRINGSVTLLSMTNSTLTGGAFSEKPAVRGIVSASYKNFSFILLRNSDLVDQTSGANLFGFMPGYTKIWGKWSVNGTLDVEFFDHVKELNLAAPELTILHKGIVETEVFMGYARTFTSKQNIYIVRPSVAKCYQGFTFRAYAWYVKWGQDKISFAGEISKQVAPQWKVSVFGHLNNVNLSESKTFGAVRGTYAF